ncbi:hypothetical protein I3760_15G028200 [Carya illinoinensis]|nr:hypothetical protein I3760_15G028200 [Carya illinoinensis]
MTELNTSLNAYVRKRFFYLTEEILKANPNIGNYKAPSLNSREAALKAIKEWGQPISKITHLVFCTMTGFDMPGADFQLTKLLGLNPSVNRCMIYQQGCYAGGTALRLAKDLAENNASACVLVVCSENMTMSFHGRSESHLDILIGQAIFSDGAMAAIVGASPSTLTEHPLFELVWVTQSIIPDTEDGVVGKLCEMGMTYYLLTNLAESIGNNIKNCMIEAFSSIDSSQNPRKPQHVLTEYGEHGNMASPCVLFILDKMREKSMEEGKATTGDGLEWGVLFGFGPDLTVETIVLLSIPVKNINAC